MSLIEIVLVALSLSMDTLAVTVSCSLSLKKAPLGRILGTAATFGLIQALLMFVGWGLGAGVLSLIYKIAGWIGFALLLYIGGSMIWNSFKGEDSKTADLLGFKALVLAGVATSIDALAVGISYAMTSMDFVTILLCNAVTFVVTFICAIAGIYGGSRVLGRFGSTAEVIGGIVLIIIGFQILLG